MGGLQCLWHKWCGLCQAEFLIRNTPWQPHRDRWIIQHTFFSSFCICLWRSAILKLDWFQVCSWPDYRGSQYPLLQILILLQNIWSAFLQVFDASCCRYLISFAEYLFSFAGIWFLLQSIWSPFFAGIWVQLLQVFDFSCKVFDQLWRYLIPFENIGENLMFANLVVKFLGKYWIMSSLVYSCILM